MKRRQAVDIEFANEHLRRLCHDEARAKKSLGEPGARKLGARLDDLLAAPSLEAMRLLPGRCHELKGDRAGCLALDLHGAKRLVVEPLDKPPPTKPDGGLDWTRVTGVRVVYVGDYHD
jgi:proteic killer suppression protein